MSAINKFECPICMDDIELNKNCVTTECGHCFHASCLMRSVAHNGFGCPYCRTAMAEAPEEDEESEYESEVDEEEVDPLEDNDMLRGFRFFFNNVYGVEHDEDDVEEEQANEEAERAYAVQQEEIVKPNAAFITQKLVEQGVTMEQLIKALLKDHEEYDAEEEEALRIDDEIFGKMRIIISNYTPQQAAAVEPQPAEQATPQPQPAEQAAPQAEVDYSAQPKRRSDAPVRRIMMHV